MIKIVSVFSSKFYYFRYITCSLLTSLCDSFLLYEVGNFPKLKEVVLVCLLLVKVGLLPSGCVWWCCK